MATNRLVYALFTGRDPRVFRRGESSEGRFLHVFSWDDGSLVGIFRLDRPILSIAIDTAGTTLYGASFTAAQIYRFRLPELPQGTRATDAAFEQLGRSAWNHKGNHVRTEARGSTSSMAIHAHGRPCSIITYAVQIVHATRRCSRVT